MGGAQQDTDPQGNAMFRDLRVPGSYTVTAISQIAGETHSAARKSVSLTMSGTNATATLTLSGVGNVAGTVVGSDGTTPVENAQITLQFQGPLFAHEQVTGLSDAQGQFSFPDVPLGPFLVTAASQSLAASENGSITSPGETNVVALQLGASGSLLGRVVRADGITPVGGVDVAIDYMAQSANAGRAVFRTAADGMFRFDNIPVGAIHVASAAPAFGGIIDFNTALTTNGQARDLGDIPFDEDLPSVVQVTPPDTAIEVPINTVVQLLFSEALDTNSIHSSGIFIRGTNGATVDATLSLVPDTNGVQRIVEIAPVAPLHSKQSYEVIVLAGDLPGPTGGLLGSGPRDLVGRAMAAPFLSRFTTSDGDPPVLVSLFPSNNAVQIDPRAVPRLTFNETLNSTSFVFTVTGPGGPVAGAAAVGINGQALSFVPTAFLLPNTTYTLTVSNVFDLAGNRAVGEPFTATFNTLDTVGPAIADLRIASNAPPVGGATVLVEAELANTNEPGASVRFTQDFAALDNATNAPFHVPVTLPLAGSTTIRAIARDQFGNDGPVSDLVITVQSNQLPTIQFVRLSPTNGPAPSGSLVAVDVVASDDSGISELRAMVSGIGTNAILQTNSNLLHIRGLVPMDAAAGAQITIQAEAIDDIGQSSGQQLLTIPVSDGTPPTLAIQSPAPGSALSPGATLPVQLQLADNFGVTSIELSVSGAFTAFVQSAVSPPLTNGVRTVNLDVPPDAPANGEPVRLTVRALDAAGNSSTERPGLVTHLTFDTSIDLGKDASQNGNDAMVNNSPAFSSTGHRRRRGRSDRRRRLLQLGRRNESGRGCPRGALHVLRLGEDDPDIRHRQLPVICRRRNCVCRCAGRARRTAVRHHPHGLDRLEAQRLCRECQRRRPALYLGHQHRGLGATGRVARPSR